MQMEQWGPVTLVTLAILAGWFIYQYLEPFLLARRRAFLRELYVPTSWVRRLFWRGELLRWLLGAKALALGALSIVLIVGSTPYEQFALLAGLPILAVSSMLAWWLLQRHISSDYRFATSLRFGFWIAFAFALVGMTWWAVAIYAVPSTTGLHWVDVARQAFEQAATDAAWEPFGYLIGVNAALSTTGWHLLQVVSIDGAWGHAAYLIICSLVLGWFALKLAIIWMVPLGFASAIHRQKQNDWQILGDGSFGRVFTICLGIIFLVYLGLTQVSCTGSMLRDPAIAEAPIPPLEDPCEHLPINLAAELESEASSWRAEQQLAFEREIARLVFAELDIAFVQIEKGVDLFLDWNYSVWGQYQQLAYMGMSATGQSNLDAFIASKIDEFVGPKIQIALRELDDVFEDFVRSESMRIWREHAALVDGLIGDARCRSALSSPIDLTTFMEKSLVGAGSGAAILAARIGTSTGARVVGRQAISKFLNVLGTKLALRAPYVLASTWVGKACGPAAIVCAPVFAVVTWVITDILINMGDEALNREELRSEILAALHADRVELEDRLNEAYMAMAASLFSNIQAHQEQVFNPLRDGGRPVD